MNAQELLVGLETLLVSTLKDFAFPAPPDAPSERDVTVYLHDVPEECSSQFPLVVIRWLSGITEGEGASQYAEDTVLLYLCVYAGNQREAGLLTANLLDALRGTLWMERVISRKFCLQGSIKAHIPEPQQQINSFHVATIQATYRYGIPVQPVGNIKGESNGRY